MIFSGFKKTMSGRQYKFHLDKNKGFSLVEVMVVVGITVLLSGIILSYNRSSEERIIVSREHSLIVGLLNRAKVLTLQRYKNPDGGEFEVCGFGLFIEAGGRVTLYEDLGRGGCGEGFDNDYRFTPDSSEVMEVANLDARVSLLGIPEVGLDLVFVPPDLRVRSSASSFPVTIEVVGKASGFKSVLGVSSVGQIVNL